MKNKTKILKNDFIFEKKKVKIKIFVVTSASSKIITAPFPILETEMIQNH